MVKVGEARVAIMPSGFGGDAARAILGDDSPKVVTLAPFLVRPQRGVLELRIPDDSRPNGLRAILIGRQTAKRWLKELGEHFMDCD